MIELVSAAAKGTVGSEARSGDRDFLFPSFQNLQKGRSGEFPVNGTTALRFSLPSDL
jgi:hypothetical protein